MKSSQTRTVLNSRPLALWTVPTMKSEAQQQKLPQRLYFSFFIKLKKHIIPIATLTQTCVVAIAFGALLQSRHQLRDVNLVFIHNLHFGHELVVLGQLGVVLEGAERVVALQEGADQRVLDV